MNKGINPSEPYNWLIDRAFCKYTPIVRLPTSNRIADTKAPINAGFRVPVTWIMAEDFEPVLVFGDRTLSRYRSIARKQLPPDQANVLARLSALVRTAIGQG